MKISAIRTNIPLKNSQKPNFSAKSDKKDIVILDNFTFKEIDIDNDGADDFTHGEFVEKVLTTKLSDSYNYVEFDCGKKANRSMSIRALHKSLDDALGYVSDNPESVVACNFSVGHYADINKLKRVLKADVTPENIADYKSNFYEYLANTKSFNHLLQMLKQLNQIAKLTPLYVAAGNKGNKEISSFSFTKDANIVAATDFDGNITDYSANHSLINRAAKGDYFVTPVIKNGTVAGYDINDDGKLDIKLNELDRSENIRYFIGTSADAMVVKVSDVFPYAREVDQCTNTETIYVFEDGEWVESELQNDDVKNSQMFNRNVTGAYLPQIKKTKGWENSLFELKDVFDNCLISKSCYKDWSKIGKYIDHMSLTEYINEGIEPKILDENGKGKLIFNPYKDSKNHMFETVINYFWGCSWAAPTALSEDLLA